MNILRIASAFALLPLCLSAQSQITTSKILHLNSSVLINGFETAGDINGTTLTQNGGLLTSSLTTGLTGGLSCGHLTIASRQTAGYPNITFMAPASGWDFTKIGGITLDITNTQSYPQIIELGFTDSAGVQMDVPIKVFPQSSITYHIGSEQMVDNTATWNLTRLSNPWQVLFFTPWAYPSANFNKAKVVNISLFARMPGPAIDLYLDELRTLPGYDVNAFATGYVDQFGQNAKITWYNKLTSLNDFATRKTAEAADLAASPSVPGWDAYGGSLSGPQFAPNNFFYTKFDGKRWWLVDPAGFPFFASGVGIVTSNKPTVTSGREYMFASLPATTSTLGQFFEQSRQRFSPNQTYGTSYNFYGSNLYRKFGATYQADWLNLTLRRFSSWGFNTVSSGSDTATSPYIPHIVELISGGYDNTLAPIAGHWAPMPDVFDDRFATSIATNNQAVITANLNDRKLIGYYVDSEMQWSGYGPYGDLSVPYAAWNTNGGAVRTKAQFVNMMVAKYLTLDALNAAWGTSFSDWQHALAPSLLPYPPSPALNADLHLMLKTYSDKYFSTVRTALKALDPNHLYMGSKISYFIPEVIASANAYCDVISFNQYGAPPTLANCPWMVGMTKPFFVGEFHAGSMERGLSMPGIYPVAIDRQRTDYYAAYMRAAASNPMLVGCCWFQYVDAPCTGEDRSGQSINNGLVDVTDTPYQNMVVTCRAVNYTLYPLHFAAQ